MAETQLAVTDKTVEGLIKQLEVKRENGLVFPKGYSIQNAMNAAYLILKDTEDKNGSRLLEVCTKDSVVNALMQMATQGLNPLKKQCYFVAYGNKCQLLPSYFGTLTVLNRVQNLKCQPVANIVYQGDVFEIGYDLDSGEKKILKHETKLENMDNPILAAYAIIKTENETVVEIMTKKQLENSWAQGQSWQAAQKKGYKSKTHTNFSEEMAKKTVLNRASKKLINATDDSSIMSDEAIGAFNEISDNDNLDVVAESVAVEIKENANTMDFVEEPDNDIQEENEFRQENTVTVETDPVPEQGTVPAFMN